MKKWVGFSLDSNSGLSAMAGNDGNLIGEGEERVVDGLDEFFFVASGKIGTTYGAGEEGVSGEK